MTRMLPLVTALALTVAGVGLVLSRGGSEALVSPAFAQDSGSEAPVDPALAPDYGLGPTDAAVVMVEYASFTCPHCTHFHEDVFKPLKTDYIDTGKIRFVFREVYFDRFGLMAAQIARCGGEMRYFAMIDMLFAQQDKWIGAGEASEIEANLRKLGKVAGLSDAQIDTCLADEPVTNAMVANFQTHFTEDGVEGTPSFTLNGKLYSNMSYAGIKALLDETVAAN